MSREGDYLVFAAEQYRFAKGLSGRELVELFAKYNVNRHILDMFELFHIESEQNMIAAVDEYIANQGGKVPSFMKCAGTLSHEAAEELRATQVEFSRVDEEMWN